MKQIDEWHLDFLIADAARLQRKIFENRMGKKLGLARSQWQLLNRVGRYPSSSQSELAESLEVEKAFAGRLVEQLEKRGLLERRVDSTDRRVKRIFLTKMGREMHDILGPLGVSLVEEELSDFSERDRNKFVDMMVIVKHRLQIMSDEIDATKDLQTDAGKT